MRAITSKIALPHKPSGRLDFPLGGSTVAKRSSTRRREGYLADYRLSETYLLQADRSAGRAGIITGFAPDGSLVLVKIWPRRKGMEDSELEEIWRHELRQLHRLAGFPGASETIAQLKQAGLDEQGFYLILDPGQRTPLHDLLDHIPTGHWLKQPRLPRNRVSVWRNLIRLSRGLETLHAQGLLHRNLDEWAVLTSGLDQPDFQLTGFEWSMRIASGYVNRIRRGQVSNNQHYSFRHDWLMFGLMAGRLLNINVNRLLDLRIAPSEIADHISTGEAKLLREIIHGDSEGRLDGDLVARRIEEVLHTLNSEVAALDPKFYLVARIGTDAAGGQNKGGFWRGG